MGKFEAYEIDSNNMNKAVWQVVVHTEDGILKCGRINEPVVATYHADLPFRATREDGSNQSFHKTWEDAYNHLTGHGHYEN